MQANPGMSIQNHQINPPGTNRAIASETKIKPIPVKKLLAALSIDGAPRRLRPGLSVISVS
jgi:hypothetical protein